MLLFENTKLYFEILKLIAFDIIFIVYAAVRQVKSFDAF